MPLCFCVAAFFRLLPSLTCKPSSVVYGHLSGRIVADAFKRYSRRTSGEQPYATCAQSCTGRGLHGTPRCRGVGELLPPLSILTGKILRSVSVALSLKSPPPDVIRRSALRCPDFPHGKKPRGRMINSDYYYTRKAYKKSTLSAPRFQTIFCVKRLSFDGKYYKIYTERFFEKRSRIL